MLQIQGLTKAYAGRVLFEDVTWNVADEDRIGLTGPNGAGKTTLMRLVTRKESPDEGSISMPKGTTVGYLPQDGLHHSGKTLREEALSAFAAVLSVGEEMERLEHEMSELSPESESYLDVMQRYGECREEWERKGGFSMEARAEEVLLGLGFLKDQLDAPVESFSGGWQMRIALAKLLLEQPSILLLDEPTNHLDLEARNWLEDFLNAYPHAVIMVSHDRYFLDRVVERITEIDRRRLVDYSGNYTRYQEVRKKRLEELRARAARQRDEIEKMQRFISRFRAKASKAKQVQSRVKMLEKMELIEVPPERKLMRLRLPEPERASRVVIEVDGLDKSYGKTSVFQKARLVVERGDRLALVGPNGVGKSTLMRLLSGTETLDAGEVKLGHNVTTGYFSQERYDLSPDKTVLESMTEVSPVGKVGELRSILGAFLFHGDDVEKKVRVLSGGEKSRLALARMLLKPANVLLLDEPTNHLDLDSKAILLEALDAYKGTILFVSHDRYFLDSLATKVAEIGHGEIAIHWGGYPDFLRAKDKETLAAEAGDEPVDGAATKGEQGPKADKPGTRLSKNQQRDLDQRVEELESSIAETEIAIDSLEGRMAVPGFYDDPEGSSEVVRTHESLKAKLEALYEEWESHASTAQSS
jgi:ATP-binding cassette subfamily F protein 3